MLLWNRTAEEGYQQGQKTGAQCCVHLRVWGALEVGSYDLLQPKIAVLICVALEMGQEKEYGVLAQMGRATFGGGVLALLVAREQCTFRNPIGTNNMSIIMWENVLLEWAQSARHQPMWNTDTVLLSGCAAHI